MVGRTGAPNRDARTRCRRAPARSAAVTRLPRYPDFVSHFARAGVLVLAIALGLAACSSDAAPSFDPTGPCTTDGSAPGAYPELEARVPTSFLGAKPERLDSGRHCSAAALGSLATAGVTEVRFAGGTWTFGAERAAALAVFSAPGLTADEITDFYVAGALAASRTQVLAESRPTLAGRPGHRLDTQTGERLQTVEVWPAAAPDLVNVVITNDLPDARIADAIDAFGGR